MDLGASVAVAWHENRRRAVCPPQGVVWSTFAVVQARRRRRPFRMTPRSTADRPAARVRNACDAAQAASASRTMKISTSFSPDRNESGGRTSDHVWSTPRSLNRYVRVVARTIPSMATATTAGSSLPRQRARPASCAGRKRPCGATFEKSPCTSSANSMSSEALDTRSSSTVRPMSSRCGLSRGIRYGLPSVPNSRSFALDRGVHGVAQCRGQPSSRALRCRGRASSRPWARNFPSAETPSSCQGRSMSNMSAIVGRMSMVSTLRSLIEPVRWCGALMNSGMGAISADSVVE